MNVEKEFLSSNHKRLLNIAAWCGTLSWIALGAFILLAGTQMLQYQNMVSSYYQQMSLGEFLQNNPAEVVRLVVNMASTALQGGIYYLVLKGVSQGLNMIVETDINYREQRIAK